MYNGDKNMLECAVNPCFDLLKVGDTEIGRCMKEKGHKGSHQCSIQWS